MWSTCRIQKPYQFNFEAAEFNLLYGMNQCRMHQLVIIFSIFGHRSRYVVSTVVVTTVFDGTPSQYPSSSNYLKRNSWIKREFHHTIYVRLSDLQELLRDGFPLNSFDPREQETTEINHQTRQNCRPPKAVWEIIQIQRTYFRERKRRLLLSTGLWRTQFKVPGPRKRYKALDNIGGAYL